MKGGQFSGDGSRRDRDGEEEEGVVEEPVAFLVHKEIVPISSESGSYDRSLNVHEHISLLSIPQERQGLHLPLWR